MTYKITIGDTTYTLTESQVELLRDHELKTKSSLGAHLRYARKGHYIQARTDNHLDARFRRPGSARREGATAHALVRKGLLIEGLSRHEGRTKVQEFFLTPDALSLRGKWCRRTS